MNQRTQHFKLFLWPVLVLFCFSIMVPAKADALNFGKQGEIPIIMYHFISDNISNKWTISKDTFEQDLLYLEKQGYTTVVMADLIDFVYNGMPLPEKPVVLTFDDGDSGIYRHVWPLLEKYNMKAVVSIIGKVTDEYSSDNRTDIKYYPNLTWEQIKEMVDSGAVEIQNHSYDLHHGSGAVKLHGEEDSVYRQRLSEDLSKLQKRIQEETGRNATTFTFPFGAVSSNSDELLKEQGFLASLTCLEKVNTIKFAEPDSLFHLGRFLRPHGKTPDKFFSMVTKEEVE